MSKLLKQVDQIELRIKALIEENRSLKQKALSDQQSIKRLEEELSAVQDSVRQAIEHNNALKTANAMLGSDEYKTKTKLKINTLIREIDQCIAQLA
jgi:regulator of replication initiation timing